MNRVYQNTFVNSILKFTQNSFFKATKGLKPVSQNSFSVISRPTGSLLKWVWVVLLLFSFEKSYAQLPLQAITCTGCSTTASTGYATAALASAGAGAAATTYNLAPNASVKQCALVTTDANGTLGIIDQILTTQPSGNTVCTTNTAATRKGSLYLASGTACTGAEIQAIRKGTNSSTFNNEYVGLTPNTNYIFVFTTTVDASCIQFQTSSVRFYGGVTPQFAFNCGTATSTGSFAADGASHSGTLVVPITGTAAGAATFNVTGTGFTGTLTTTLTAGQTFVTIPITFDGTGAAGSRTLTVTSSTGGGTCTKSVTVTANSAPVITSAGAVNFAENGLGVAYTVTATDVDAGQTKTYSFDPSGVDNAQFTINPTTGAVSFITSPNFEAPTDAGGNNVYDIKVKVCDNGSPVLCATKDVAITVTNVVECNAGTTAPTLSATVKSNVCPATTGDISSLVTSTCPTGSTLEWHTTNTSLSAANKVANPASVNAGTYYPTCFDATNLCYSPTPSPGVTVTITVCGTNPVLTPPVIQTGVVNTVKSGNAATELAPTGGLGAYAYTNGSSDPACVAPSGATALPLSSNLTINASTGAYTYTRPSTPGTYYFCVKVCDSSTPTPFCSVAVYKVVVTAPVCNAGNTPPGVN